MNAVNGVNGVTTPIPVREGAPTKARRYLCEGRLTIKSIHRDRIFATCRGDGQVYDLGFAHSRWFCDCQCRTADCAHLIALRLVADRPNP